MIRIAGRTLSSKKQIRFALTPIKGVGKNNILKILAESHAQIQTSKIKDFKLTEKEFLIAKFDDLSEEAVVVIRNIIENNYIAEEDLKRKIQSEIKRLVDLNTWRGMRHKLRLPVRGQTTKTNSRTLRGNVRVSKGSGKIKATKT